MKKIGLFFAVMLVVLISACSTGFGFVPTNLKASKAYLEYWEKPGVPTDIRLRDSTQCGAGPTDRVDFGLNAIQAAQHTGETQRETYGRVFDNWQRCMLSKGYHYTGECFDNEISRALPACGAR